MVLRAKSASENASCILSSFAVVSLLKLNLTHTSLSIEVFYLNKRSSVSVEELSTDSCPAEI